jgi:glycosyltransferase involved in cell wall biosynthesis
MLKNRDIVIIGLQPWDVAIGSNCKDIAEVMSKDNRVLYVNLPMDVRQLADNYKKSWLKKRLSYLFRRDSNLVKISDNLWNFYPPVILLSANWIPSHRIFLLVNKLNNWFFARSIKKAIKRLQFNNFILFNDNDIFRGFYMKELLQPEVSVYYCRDYMMAVPYWKKHGKILEPKLISKSDACVANSLYLADYCRQYNQTSFYVGQGCNLTIYDPNRVNAVPADLQDFKSPLVGYVGAVTALRLNIDWIRFIALSRPGWNIVLIGPAEQDFKNELKSIQNIHFLGSRPVHELPAYIKAFDVCINPQLVNEVTIGNYPRKVDEYLAMKKPVVATSTAAMKAFSEHVYLSGSREEFLKQVDLALTDNSEAQQDLRRAFAETHTWENSVDKIYEAIAGSEN